MLYSIFICVKRTMFKKLTKDMIKLSNKYRKTGFIIGLMKMIKTPNYEKYTDCEYDLFYKIPVKTMDIFYFI